MPRTTYYRFFWFGPDGVGRFVRSNGVATK